MLRYAHAAVAAPAAVRSAKIVLDFGDRRRAHRTFFENVGLKSTRQRTGSGEEANGENEKFHCEN